MKKTQKDYWLNAFFIFVIAIVITILGHLTGIKTMFELGVIASAISGFATLILWIVWEPPKDIPEESIDESTTKDPCCDETCDCNKELPTTNTIQPTKESKDVQQTDSVQDTQSNKTV
jgi:hypothetical protein